jgi:hypothetical protein
MDAVPARPDWHRFMVVIAATQGFRLTERPVPLHPRRAGRSKFGLGRIPVGVMDLLSVWFQLRFGRKPMLFFGVSGALLFLLGFLVGVFVLIQRYVYGVGFRPLLDLIMVLVISGVSLFGFGFVGEMVAGQREETRALMRADRGAACSRTRTGRHRGRRARAALPLRPGRRRNAGVRRHDARAGAAFLVRPSAAAALRGGFPARRPRRGA